LYCPLKGRRKDGKPHHYPAMKRPTGYWVEVNKIQYPSPPTLIQFSGCSHPDVNPQALSQPSEQKYLDNLTFFLQSKNDAEYKERRKATGIAKPSLFRGL
ncbi:hypothetical protein DFH08DRAFT_644676, partial [Mycena albidolilacea]